MIFAEYLFFLRSSSSCNLLVLKNAISIPENMADAINDNMTTYMSFIFDDLIILRLQLQELHAFRV